MEKTTTATKTTSSTQQAVAAALDGDMQAALTEVASQAQAIIDDLGLRVKEVQATADATTARATAAAAKAETVVQTAQTALQFMARLRGMLAEEGSRASRQKNVADEVDVFVRREMEARGEEPQALYHLTRSDLLVGAALVAGVTVGTQKVAGKVSTWRAERKAAKDAAAAAAPAIV